MITTAQAWMIFRFMIFSALLCLGVGAAAFTPVTGTRTDDRGRSTQETRYSTPEEELAHRLQLEHERRHGWQEGTHPSE